VAALPLVNPANLKRSRRGLLEVIKRANPHARGVSNAL